MFWLALIPIVHFMVIYWVSSYRGTLRELHGIYSVMYLDWLFVPFNFLIPLAVDFSWLLFSIFAAISLAAIVILHVRWHRGHHPDAGRALFTTDRGLTPEGWIHFLFMAIELPLVLTVFFSKPISGYYALALLPLLVYLLSYVLIVRFVRRARLRTKPEMPFVVLGLAAVIIRLALALL